MHDLFWFAVLATAVILSLRGVLIDNGTLVRVRAKRLENPVRKPYGSATDARPGC